MTTRAAKDEALEPCAACSTRSGSISLYGVGARRRALEHPKQIRGVGWFLIRGDRLESFAQPCVGGDDHRHLRGQANAVADHGFVRIVESGQRRNRGAKHVHRMRRFDGANDVEDRSRQFARGFQFTIEFRKLHSGRQFAAQQQPGRLLECRMFGEVVDRMAAVAQLADAAVDESARRTVEIDASSAVNLDRLVCFGHLWPRSRPPPPIAVFSETTWTLSNVVSIQHGAAISRSFCQKAKRRVSRCCRSRHTAARSTPASTRSSARSRLSARGRRTLRSTATCKPTRHWWPPSPRSKVKAPGAVSGRANVSRS